MPIRRAVLAAPLLLLLLAGCVPTPEQTAPQGTGTPAPTVSSSASPTATATATPGPDTEPVTLACGDLFSAQAIYDYNPNVSLLDSFSPSADSLAGQAVAQQGLACQLVNQTSGVTIDVGLVRFVDAAYAAKLDSVSASASAASAFDGFFDTADGTGTAQFFSDPYWLTLSSAGFIEAADVTPLVDAAAGALR